MMNQIMEREHLSRSVDRDQEKPSRRVSRQQTSSFGSVDMITHWPENLACFCISEQTGSSRTRKTRFIATRCKVFMKMHQVALSMIVPAYEVLMRTDDDAKESTRNGIRGNCNVIVKKEGFSHLHCNYF